MMSKKNINDPRITQARRFVGNWIAKARGDRHVAYDADPLIEAMNRLLPGTPMNVFWRKFEIELYAADDSRFVFDQAYELLKVLNRFRSRAAQPEGTLSAKAVVESAKAHGVKRHESLLYKELGDAVMQLKAIFMRTSEDYIARGDRDVLNRIVSLLRGRWLQEFTQMDVSEKYATVAANEIMKAIRAPKGSNEELLALGNALQNLQQQRRIIASWMAVN